MKIKNYDGARIFLNHENDIFSSNKLEEHTKEKILNEKEIKNLNLENST